MSVKNFQRRVSAKRRAEEKDLKSDIPMSEELWRQVDEEYVRAKMKQQADIGGEK